MRLRAAYRITSSACERIGAGSVRPSACAVLRLRTSSNLVGCSTGRSAGLVPCRMRCRNCPPCNNNHRLDGKNSYASTRSCKRSSKASGRCWTDRTSWADGQTTEHGGELIDQNHTQIRNLAHELGLEPGVLAVAAIKATNVSVEIPANR